MAYPLGVILNRAVKGTTARHLYATITGFLLQLYMYRSQIGHPLAMTLITYAMMNFLPRNKQNKWVFVFVMAYLSGSHIYRMWVNFGGWDMDITTYTMILTCKLSALGYCYADGGLKDEDLLPEQKQYKVEMMPTTLELLSYVFFCSGCTVGPFFEFSDYKMYIEGTGRYSSIPSTFKPALIKFLKGKACLVSNLVIGTKFWALYCGTEEFTQHSFLYKVSHILCRVKLFI
jgi:hypothetical protein